MPVTAKIQIFHTQNDSRFWTNVYHVDAVDLNAAAGFANTVIVTAHQAHLFDSFRVVKTICNWLANDDFITTPMSLEGLFTASPYLPLFNTVKVNIAVAGFGRNDYKFYRGGLAEGSQTDGQLEPATITAFTDMVDGMITDSNASGVDLVDDAGNLWLTASTQAAIQMRQLHRRRRALSVPL